jgi:hypothetical protein
MVATTQFDCSLERIMGLILNKSPRRCETGVHGFLNREKVKFLLLNENRGGGLTPPA